MMFRWRVECMSSKYVCIGFDVFTRYRVALSSWYSDETLGSLCLYMTLSGVEFVIFRWCIALIRYTQCIMLWSDTLTHTTGVPTYSLTLLRYTHSYNGSADLQPHITQIHSLIQPYEPIRQCIMLWSDTLTQRGGGLGSSTIFKKFNEPYAPS